MLQYCTVIVQTCSLHSLRRSMAYSTWDLTKPIFIYLLYVYLNLLVVWLLGFGEILQFGYVTSNYVVSPWKVRTWCETDVAINFTFVHGLLNITYMGKVQVFLEVVLKTNPKLSMKSEYSHFSVNCSATPLCVLLLLHVWVLATASKNCWIEHRSVLRIFPHQHLFIALLPLTCD